jgi:L-lactate dehydrogenase complex protein LldG
VGRETFLGDIRTASVTGSLPSGPDGDPGLLVPELAPGDLVELFAANLAAVDGVVRRTTADGAVQAIEAALTDGDSECLAWDEVEIGVPGLSEALTRRGFVAVPGTVPEHPAGRLEHHGSYRELPLGITGADAGLAESGSLVLVTGPGRPRMASLIPLHHVAVLRASRIVRTFPHLLADRPDLVASGSNFVVITGPSRTADIEMTLTLGVHGPRHVTVVLIED